MTRQGDFLIYCVETYKNAKHLTGRQVAELFTRYDVWDYVYSCSLGITAATGQCSTQLPQWRQCSWWMTLGAPKVTARWGQAFTQAPQLMQASVMV